jgi:hypothetical protein
MDVVDISGLDKTAVLAALYNAAKPQGMGFLHYKPEPMTVEEAEKCFVMYGARERHYFDYVFGRVLKVDLTTEKVRTDLYNRDNGEGAAERVIGILRASGTPAHPDILAIHKAGKAASIKAVERSMNAPATVQREGAAVVVTITAHDVKDQLKPYVDKAKEQKE